MATKCPECGSTRLLAGWHCFRPDREGSDSRATCIACGKFFDLGGLQMGERLFAEDEPKVMLRRKKVAPRTTVIVRGAR